ncbi:MAG TPA: AraC family transcriptional regulator [Burkholderiaceae bacterium]|nr:AraC family transcriptional regulator [Burkholderiaceae bacterium]
MPHLARSQILTGFAPLARSLGLASERIAKSVGLDLSALNDLDARISAKAFAAMLERAAQSSNLQDFGLRLAESRELGILGPVGIVIRQETDLRSALHSLIRYMPVHNESLELRLEDERGVAVLALTVRRSGLDEVRHVTELSIGTFVRVMRKLAGPDWKPSRICFEHTAPRSDATHRRFFGCRIEFEHEFNGIVFRSSDLDAPLAMSDAMLARYAHRYLDSMMQHRADAASDKVRELVRLWLSSGTCSADRIARGLGVDRRTVHRYLTQTDQTFSSVVAEVRIELATRLLTGHRPISEIANLVGFSGQAAFSRWFTQHFGCSPSAWRESAAGTQTSPPFSRRHSARINR